jgi:hypothetical protein
VFACRREKALCGDLKVSTMGKIMRTELITVPPIVVVGVVVMKVD